MVDDTPPPGFGPMSGLNDDKLAVELALRTGAVVRGWMLVGVPSPQARTYWCEGAWNPNTRRHDMVPVYPIGWRPLPWHGQVSESRWR